MPTVSPALLGVVLFGFNTADLIVLAGYFIVILAIGWWAMLRVRNQEDYFLGGRKFGKLIQVFASFGQATSSESAVASTTMVSTNGAAGVWANIAGGLFNLPIIWFWSMWFRRVRLTTLADIYEERYDSRKMAAFYALSQCVFLMIGAGIGLVALSKTVAAIAVKSPSDLSPPEHVEYNEAHEMRDLESQDYLSLTTPQQSRLKQLRLLNPRGEFSYVNETYMTISMAIVVVLYAGIGGLEGAFITDLVQGIFLLILSVLLLPFAMTRINHLYGTHGFLGPFIAMHQQLPESHFELWGSWAVPEFTWYWILVFSLLGVIHTAVQANGMVGPASSKDDYTARYGFVVGIFLKRYATVFWGFLAMMCLLLYGLHVKDADYVWGLATRDLLGGVGFGLVGLMVACLIAAMMASMSAHQMCVAALITRNLYVPIVRQFRKPQTVLVGTTEHPEVHEPGIGDTRSDAPDDPNAGLSERHMIWMGRLFGIFYVAGAVAIATTFNSVFGLLKFLTMFNSIVAAAFWLGMLWRRANRIGAWASMILTFTIMLLLPFTLPLIPGIRGNAYLLKRTDQPPVSRIYTARQADVDQRSANIAEWNSQTAHGQSAGPRPKPLVAGEKFEKWYKFPPRSIFWGGDIAVINGHDQGQGWAGICRATVIHSTKRFRC
jgi:SSS family solute:Na+ symporter